jgi:GDSL-like lipase/acylhydrolase family protein
MRGRQLPWIVAAIALIAFVASFTELQRMRRRFGEVTHHQFHDHQDVRRYIIKAALAGLDQPIVVIGDSITEMARLPDTICGRPVVNAGIGGATIRDFQSLSIWDDTARPSLIVIALGANDAAADDAAQDFSILISRLKAMTPNILAVAVASPDPSQATNRKIALAAHAADIPLIDEPIPAEDIFDGMHLKRSGYAIWIPSVVGAAESSLGCKTASNRIE